MDYRELVAYAKRQIVEIHPDALAGAGDEYVVIDVRELEERRQGAIPGSLFLSKGVLERDIATTVTEPSTPVVVYCAAGLRSALAAVSLEAMGYTNVASLRGGFDQWKADGHPWDLPHELSVDQRIRYDRHLKLPEIGQAGQQALLDASVLVIGAGGLGSPALLYLAAAGVGTIGIVDGDRVDASNLQRQVIHDGSRLGSLKVESAGARIAALNSDTAIELHPVRLDSSNALDIMSGYDVIVDGADNFPTRYLVNDASLHLGIPVVHGSIFRFEGQATVFAPYSGPCYRCLFPSPPPPELAPSCAEAGVLGALPGIIGSVQAIEAIKLVLDLGTPLTGTLAIYDALEQRWANLSFARDPACPACGDPERRPLLIDYDETCAVPV